MSTSHTFIRETHIVSADSREWLVAPRSELEQAGIFMAGISHAGSRFEFVRLNMRFPQLLVCFGGTGKVWIGGRWHTCENGDAYVTPASVHHAYHGCRGGRWKIAWILYSPTGTRLFNSTEPKLIRLDPRPFKDIITGIFRESLSGRTSGLFSKWCELLQLHGERALQQAFPGDSLWQIWEAVSHNLAAEWSNDSLATLACVSSEHLRRLCHRQLGCPPMQQVTRMRMNQAATLLATSSLKIDAIARGVGYANRFAFSNAFSQHFGISPGAYRHSKEHDETQNASEGV